MEVKSESEVAQSCPTLRDPMDCSLPGSSIHGFSRQEYWSGLPLPSPFKTLIYICCLQDTHLKTRDTCRLKVKGWKNIFHANRDQKKAGVAILLSDKIDFKTKAVKRDKDGHYIMIKGSIQEEDITIIIIYAPNTGAPQYVIQMLQV